MIFKFPITIIAFILFIIATQSTSKYEGVSWNEKKQLWQAEFYLNGKTNKSYFKNEFDAAKHINQLCQNMGIPSKNPELPEISNQQTNQQTSQYKGVFWHKKSGKWYALMCLKGEKPKYGGIFNDQLDAAKSVNQICEKLEIPLQNPGIAGMPNDQSQRKEKSSQYKGVCWHKKSGKWYVLMCLKGEKPKYGGIFNDQLDAAKRINQICEKLEIPLQNPGIAGMSNDQSQRKEKSSQYKGVCWHKESGKWFVQMYLKGQNNKYGGTFNDELNAAKRVNQLCEKLEIPLRNPGIAGMPNEQSQRGAKISQYKGVSFHKESGNWSSILCLKGQKPKYGGSFMTELNAAKRVNQLCEESEIPPKNPGIFGIPIQKLYKKEKISQYKGVHWHKKSGKWYAHLRLRGGQQKIGGVFKDELDAAKRVNQLCEEMKVPLRNHGISGLPTQQYHKTEKTSQYKGVSFQKESRKWHAFLRSTAGKKKFCGSFNDELDAAKRVNQLCEEMKLPLRNHGILGLPVQQYHKREKTSQYKGVYYKKSSGKWHASLRLNTRKQKSGGLFKNELDAAKRVNQMCEALKIPTKNPGIETYKDGKNQVIAKGTNGINSSKILKNNDNDDGVGNKKRKHKKEFIAEEYYFYDNFLK